MKQPSGFLYWAITAGGILLLAGGLVLLRMGGDGQVLPYLMLGAGCGVFGYGAGELAAGAAARKDPQMARQLAIEQQDERNRAIADRSKAKAYDLMLYLFAALMVAFSLIPDTPLPVILLMVAGYLLVVAFQIYWLVRLNKEM